MSSVVIPSSRPPIVYPDSDGKPMADNTIQWEWVVKITVNLKRLFAADPNVFVAGDLFWYPVDGHPEIVAAPDTMVVFGCPKGHRMSYMQWLEGGIPPQVMFEVLAPSNRPPEMRQKLEFYRRYGVEEYYVYDPGPRPIHLEGYLRQGDQLVEISNMNGHVSPRLGVRFVMAPGGLSLIRPNGQPFLTDDELAERAERAEQERLRAEQAIREAEDLRRRLRELGHDNA